MQLAPVANAWHYVCPEILILRINLRMGRLRGASGAIVISTVHVFFKSNLLILLSTSNHLTFADEIESVRL